MVAAGGGDTVSTLSVAASSTGSTGITYGGAANAIGGAAGGFAAGGLQGGNLNSALWGATAGSLTGYLSGGTHLQNPIEQLGKVGTAIANAQVQDLGQMGLRYVMNQQMSRVSARAAARLGVSPEALDVSLMLLSIAGNELVGSRFRSDDREFTLSDQVGFRGYGNRSGAAGYVFDTVDAILAFQGKPTASFSHFAYSGLAGRERVLTGHSLGTLDASYAVSHGLASRAELFSVPFGNVAPPAANVRLGNLDPVNGGFFGHLLNWGGRACSIGIAHGYDKYAKSGC